jgi:hypothetical protein
LYGCLEIIAKDNFGMDKLPFPLSALTHPPENRLCSEINEFIRQCDKVDLGDDTDAQIIKLIHHLKLNPPIESYENPQLTNHELTIKECNFKSHIFWFGIDLPGSKYNLFGNLQYFSSFFIDMFFGNLTEFMDHLKSLCKQEIQTKLSKREGYCCFSPIFAPILGLNIKDLKEKAGFSAYEKMTFSSMYSGCNENRHAKILEKLINYGANVNAHDIHGYTPLHYAVLYVNHDMVTILLENGANPNAECVSGNRPLNILMRSRSEEEMRLIDILLQYDAQLINKYTANELRSTVEQFGRLDLAINVRNTHPREKNECERCVKPAPRSCASCGLVYYCTPACQKMDWKFHKVTCRLKKERMKEVD